MPSPQKRSTAVKITMTPEMHARLRDLAERLGQTPATVASFAVSHYVATQSAALQASEKAVAGMVESMAGPMKDLFAKMAEGAE